MEDPVATYTRIQSPGLPAASGLRTAEPVGDRDAGRVPGRSRWATVLASGFVEERRRAGRAGDAAARRGPLTGQPVR
jgi:hypothetical protein